MPKREYNIASIILINEHNEILLQKKDLRFKRWPGRWSMFGGGIEDGETPEETIQREIAEEIRVKIYNFKLYKTFVYEDEDRAGIMHVFIAFFQGELSDISLGEGAGYAFFAPEEIAGLQLIDHDDKIIKEYITANK
jgi:8-oxo-dGTP diphosphatase